ncbi:hypothetical protein BDC45DRAFT_556160 [Circinella umbellata]|nr:hypothetical protein BDC45DRAFT_556160 [Circinella umbellata]
MPQKTRNIFKTPQLISGIEEMRIKRIQIITLKELNLRVMDRRSCASHIVDLLNPDILKERLDISAVEAELQTLMDKCPKLQLRLNTVWCAPLSSQVPSVQKIWVQGMNKPTLSCLKYNVSRGQQQHIFLLAINWKEITGYLFTISSYQDVYIARRVGALINPNTLNDIAKIYDTLDLLYKWKHHHERMIAVLSSAIASSDTISISIDGIFDAIFKSRSRDPVTARYNDISRDTKRASLYRINVITNS